MTDITDMPVFDVDSFMNTEVEEANSTEFVPIPEGEYMAVIDKAEPKVTQGGKPFISVAWKLDAPGNEEANEKTVYQTVWLDITNAGSLDFGKGKNVSLGRLREALGQNTPGQRWNPGMLAGNVAKVSVKQQPDRENPEVIYSRVMQVAKAA